MTYRRFKTTAMILLFGFVFIFQVIASSFIEFYPTELLVALGFSIGVGMVIGTGYALIRPDGDFWAALRKAPVDEPVHATPRARVVLRTRAAFSARPVPI